MEETLGHRRKHVRRDCDRSSRKTGNRHQVRISTEASDVSLNPLQSHYLILETEVTRTFSRPSRHKAERSKAVVDRHDDDFAIHQIVRASLIDSSSELERSAMDEEDHRAVPYQVGSEDVELQTVFGHAQVSLGPGWKHCGP